MHFALQALLPLGYEAEPYAHLVARQLAHASGAVRETACRVLANTEEVSAGESGQDKLERFEEFWIHLNAQRDFVQTFCETAHF